MLDEFIEIETEKKKEKREEEKRQVVVEEFEKAEAITEVEESRAEEEAIVEAEEGIREVKKSEKMHIIADIKDPEHKSRCPYCDEWMGRLHAGALYLYTKHGEIYALADMDHVYDGCKHGLIENIRFLYRMMADLRAKGLKVFAVGKAYDDDLYAWVYGGGRDLEYQGMKVIVFEASKTVEDFKKFSYGLQSVSRA